VVEKIKGYNKNWQYAVNKLHTAGIKRITFYQENEVVNRKEIKK